MKMGLGLNLGQHSAPLPWISGLAATALLGAAQFTGSASFNAATIQLFRGATGAGPGAAVAVGDPVAVTPGGAVDVTFGDERANTIANHDFAAGSTGWTVPTDFSVGAGVATKTAGAPSRFLSQATAILAAAVVRYAFDVTAITAGSFRSRIQGSTDVDGSTRTTVGRQVGTLIAPVSPALIGIVGSPAGAGSVTNLIAYVETADCLAQGTADFWIAAITAGGFVGALSGPFPLTIV